MKRTEESGITLIVLAITVIVMLILSAIAINAAIGDGGLIGRAEDAASRYDRVENEELAYMNGMSHRYDNVIDNTSAVRPSIKDIKVTTKDRSATLVVTATNVEYYRYYYKKASENNYTLLSEQNGNAYTIDGLELDEKYNVKVEAINGEKKAEREITVSIGDVISAEGNIKFSNLVWSNKKASVTMSTTSNYTIQYQVNGENEGAWITGTKAENLNLNDVVYVRLWNGSKGGKSTSLTVTEITSPIVNVSIGQVTTNSIEVIADAQDNESGMPDNPEYEFYIKKTSEGNFPTNPEYRGNNAYCTFRNLTNNTNYDIKVVTYDNAGNQGSNISYNNRTVAITGEGGEISFGAVEWQSDHTARVTISTTTTYTIQYQVNGTSEGNWTTGTVASNLRLNDRLYARLWDGTSSGGMIDTVISDTVIPNAADIQIAKQSANISETITATVRQSDSQSGVNIGNCRWVYNTVSGNVGTNANSYTGGNFTSENDTIQLTASAPGTYYLHVLTIDNAGQARETKAGPVTVNRLVTGLTLDQDNLQMTIGDMKSITAEVTPADASDKGVTWSSDNESVATVVDGIVTAVGKGTATITATTTDGSGISASCNVIVDTYVDATVVLGTGQIKTWSSASVFRRSETPYNANDPDNLAGQYSTISATGSYGVETWVDADGIQWWYCKAKTVQLPSRISSIFQGMVSTNTIQELYLSEFDTSGVTTTVSTSTISGGYTMYYYPFATRNSHGGKMTLWSSLKTIHLDGCDFSNITSMEYMFYGTGIETIDFSTLKDGGSTTRNLTNMYYMFAYCDNLKQVNFGSMNTQAVTNMSNMFYDCPSLQTVNMSSFNTISCTNFRNMFRDCTSLQNVIVGSRFTNNAAETLDLQLIFNGVPASFNKDCFGWTNGTWNSNGSFTKN